MSEWKKVQLGRIAKIQTGPFGSQLHQEDYVEGGIPLVTVKNLGERRISRYNLDGVSKEDSERLSKYRLLKGDIVFSRVGYIDRSSLVQDEEVGWLFSSSTLVARPNRNIIFPGYLFYFLNTPNFKRYIDNSAVGATRPSLNTRILSECEIEFPSLMEQKAIAHILGTLDEKIELNRKMNQTLESMAQTLFKSWFVDFDPVIDNALAQGNDIPEELQARAGKRKGLSDSKKLLSTNPSLAAQFPAAFVFNETLGKWIPEGWEVKSLYDSAEFVNGASFKSEYFTDKKNGKPIIKIVELKDGVTEQTKFTTQQMPAKYSITKGDLLYSWSGSPDTSLSAFLWSGEDGWLNQHVFNVVTKDENHKAYCYSLLNELKPFLIAIAKDKQTTGLGHITVKDMKNLYVVQPSTHFDDLIDNSIGPIFKKVFQLQLENKTLTQLRDRLLPELISGRVRVKEELKYLNI